jgi:hypothetical protein
MLCLVQIVCLGRMDSDRRASIRPRRLKLVQSHLHGLPRPAIVRKGMQRRLLRLAAAVNRQCPY